MIQNIAETNHCDVVVIGGSFAGLSAGLVLGRSMKHIVVIDSNDPCFRRSAHTYGWILHDGSNPLQLLKSARTDLGAYENIHFLSDTATDVRQSSDGFLIATKGSRPIIAKKIILATGVKEVFPPISGLADCWGLSVFHCPYCQAFEVKNKMIGLIGSGDYAFERIRLLSGWSGNLMLFTNGPNGLTDLQAQTLRSRNISVVEEPVKMIAHSGGVMSKLILQNDHRYPLDAIFIKPDFIQPGELAEKLGCKLNEAGYLIAGDSGATNIPGVYAVGDCTTSFRTVATSTAAGVRAAVAINNELMTERSI